MLAADADVASAASKIKKVLEWHETARILYWPNWPNLNYYLSSEFAFGSLKDVRFWIPLPKKEKTPHLRVSRRQTQTKDSKELIFKCYAHKFWVLVAHATHLWVSLYKQEGTSNCLTQGSKPLNRASGPVQSFEINTWIVHLQCPEVF